MRLLSPAAPWLPLRVVAVVNVSPDGTISSSCYAYRIVADPSRNVHGSLSYQWSYQPAQPVAILAHPPAPLGHRCFEQVGFGAARRIKACDSVPAADAAAIGAELLALVRPWETLLSRLASVFGPVPASIPGLSYHSLSLSAAIDYDLGARHANMPARRKSGEIRVMLLRAPQNHVGETRWSRTATTRGMATKTDWLPATTLRTLPGMDEWKLDNLIGAWRQASRVASARFGDQIRRLISPPRSPAIGKPARRS
jgi:hypothetical protein